MIKDEIEKAQRAVRTDAYQLSIGEIVNMYRDDELIIDPDFQRLFRWEIGQKSKLIESLLLGIPIPSIFVFEKENSKWELIDGLQRISTILEFVGILRDVDTCENRPPSCLVGTKYLPSLKNAVWEKADQIKELDVDDQNEIGKELQLAIRRRRISVEILKRPSDNDTKYDLFQRLNAGGTPANAQELRNCIIIMISKKYFNFMKELGENTDFLSVISSSASQRQKQAHMEYVSRFLVQTFVDYDGKLDVEEYIDEGIRDLASNGEIEVARETFVTTFSILNKLYGKDAFRRIEGGKHSGKVVLAAFECIAVGVARNIKKVLSKKNPEKFVENKVAKFWEETGIENFFTPGLRGTTRIQRTIPFGEKWFSR